MSAPACQTDREALIERMGPVAEDVTGHVHRRDAEAVHQSLIGLDVMELRALVIVLASLRKPSRLRREDGIVDAIAVDRAAAGEAVILTKTERLLAAAQLVQQKLGVNEISERLGVSGTHARQLIEQFSPAAHPAEDHPGDSTGEPAGGRRSLVDLTGFDISPGTFFLTTETALGPVA